MSPILASTVVHQAVFDLTNLGGLALSVLGTFYLAYDLLDRPHGWLRRLVQLITVWLVACLAGDLILALGEEVTCTHPPCLGTVLSLLGGNIALALIVPGFIILVVPLLPPLLHLFARVISWLSPGQATRLIKRLSAWLARTETQVSGFPGTLWNDASPPPSNNLDPNLQALSGNNALWLPTQTGRGMWLRESLAPPFPLPYASFHAGERVHPAPGKLLKHAVGLQPSPTLIIVSASETAPVPSMEGYTAVYLLPQHFTQASLAAGTAPQPALETASSGKNLTITKPALFSWKACCTGMILTLLVLLIGSLVDRPAVEGGTIAEQLAVLVFVFLVYMVMFGSALGFLPFISWWADTLAKPKLGFFGILFILLGVVAQAGQPIADLLGVVIH